MKKNYFVIFLICVSSLFTHEGIFDKKYKFIFGYKYTQAKVLLQSIEKEEILVDLEGKQYEYFDKIYKEYRIESLSNNVFCSFETKPFNKIWYSLYFHLIPSQTVKFNESRRLVTTEYGWCGGLGLSYSLFPLTLFSVGIEIFGKTFFEKYKFNCYVSSDNKYNVDVELFNTNISCGIDFSRIFLKLVEIHCGGELVYRNSSLIDKVNFYTVSGEETITQIFLSNRIYLTKNESINLNIVKSIDCNNLVISAGFVIGW